MASEPRVEFSSEWATAMVKTASALLTSERQASLYADALSVETAWARTDFTSFPDRRGPPRPLPSSTPCEWLTTRPTTLFYGQLQRSSCRKAALGKSDASTVAIAGSASVGVVALAVAAKSVGVVTITTAAGVSVVVEAKEARRVSVVAQNAAK